MCGIAGFLDIVVAWDAETMLAIVKRMADTLSHRGPDDAGIWVDPHAGIALGHRRLSIIDLSAEGHQPMRSACGRYVIVFNGEIYNYLELRKELENTPHPNPLPQGERGIRRCPLPQGQKGIKKWRGHSDTEVMLAAISEWGLEAAVRRFNGMFAFAVWDKKTQTLYLGRDRLGEKPLYYGWAGKTFVFGSELKALRAHPKFRPEINRDALALYLRHNYVPGPYSIFKGIFKLPPGTLLAVNKDSHCNIPTPTPYWSAREVTEQGVKNMFRGSEPEIVSRLDGLLRDAVKLRMEADVPLGAFLSGGIDSSTVVALMQAQSGRPVRTFTIGFDVDGYDEAPHAKAVARHLGTEHTELYVSPKETIEVIPKLPSIYDEPFSDSSQIPTYLVSKMARHYVKVSLSGDGGDELFGGYNRYFWGRNIWRGIKWIPKTLRSAAARLVTSVSPRAWEGTLGRRRWFLPKTVNQELIGDRLHKLSEVLAVEDPEAMYQQLVSHWKTPASLVLGASEPPTTLTDRHAWARLPDFTQRMMYLDTVMYLPDDILTKVDRASMAVSLEARVPFLDHLIIEFAWRLPLSFKIHNGKGKWLLRKVLAQYLPAKLIDRPKMGFGVPIDHWLRGPLRDWAETLLSESRLRDEEFFAPAPIRQKWGEHLSGRRNWQYHLWDILMFQAWLEYWAA